MLAKWILFSKCLLIKIQTKKGKASATEALNKHWQDMREHTQIAVFTAQDAQRSHLHLETSNHSDTANTWSLSSASSWSDPIFPPWENSYINRDKQLHKWPVHLAAHVRIWECSSSLSATATGGHFPGASSWLSELSSHAMSWLQPLDIPNSSSIPWTLPMKCICLPATSCPPAVRIKHKQQFITK